MGSSLPAPPKARPSGLTKQELLAEEYAPTAGREGSGGARLPARLSLTVKIKSRYRKRRVRVPRESDLWRAHLCHLLRLCVDPAGFARGPGNGASLGPAGGRAQGSARPLRGRHRGGSSARRRGLSRPGPGSPREPWSLCAGRPHAEKGAHPEGGAASCPGGLARSASG